MKSLALAGLTREDVTSPALSAAAHTRQRTDQQRSGAHEIVHPNRTPTKRSLATRTAA